MMRSALLVAALMGVCPRLATAQGTPDGGRKPADSVRLVTSDIANFWRAHTLAAGKEGAERIRIFQTVYLQPGSPGLRDWTRLRLMNRDTVRARLIAAGWTGQTLDSLYRLPRGTRARDSLERAVEPVGERSGAEELVAAIGRYPRYYAGVRATTLSLDTASTVKAAVRRGLTRLAALYPEARFPDVYFLIGTISTGGTAGPSGMLIGTEQYGSGPDTPYDELPEWARVVFAANSFARLPHIVVHEAVHTQQGPRSPSQKNTLLRHALMEGGADFLTELALGAPATPTAGQRYGEAHERAVWLDFKDEMATDSTISTWMYNGRVPFPKNHGATDIGYWMGARIARAYYERAADKRAAVRALLLLADPERLLAESGYAAYAEALPDR
jgi:hypothetical protein